VYPKSLSSGFGEYDIKITLADSYGGKNVYTFQVVNDNPEADSEAEAFIPDFDFLKKSKAKKARMQLPDFDAANRGSDPLEAELLDISASGVLTIEFS